MANSLERKGFHVLRGNQQRAKAKTSLEGITKVESGKHPIWHFYVYTDTSALGHRFLPWCKCAGQRANSGCKTRQKAVLSRITDLVTQDQPRDLVACKQNDIENRIEDEENEKKTKKMKT